MEGDDVPNPGGSSRIEKFLKNLSSRGLNAPMNRSEDIGEWSVRAVSGTKDFQRKPLVINGNSLWSGDRSASFADDNPDSLLRNYLIFVRDMRGERREPSIRLRSEDISVLAAHLRLPDDIVLGGLLDLMGATRTQRSMMMAMLAAGVLTLVISGSFITELSTDGVSVGMDRLANAVQSMVSGSDASTAATTSTADAPTAAASAAASATATEAASAALAESTTAAAAATQAAATATGEETAATRTALTEAAAHPFIGTSASGPRDDIAAAETSSVLLQQAVVVPTESVVQEPVSIGATSDGSTVASVAPPVPAAPSEPIATAILPDGSTVGVAAPPAPLTPTPVDDQSSTAELTDGSTVGVAAPPVPQPPAG